VFACGGGSGGSHGGSPDEALPDPTGSDLYTDPDAEAGDGTPLPRPITDPDGEDSFDASEFSEADQARIAELEADPEWQAKITEMETKYPGLTRAELYDIINGESNFKPDARNPSGASGLFQFMPQSASELGYNTDQIAQMSPTQQLNVYDEYLDRWNYSGDNHLGMMQAAPAFASRGGGSVIYPVGSAAHAQNPGWRPSGGGHITVQSINDYYNRSS
jgi:soluble lytic murein transglycosylase-like protein